MLYFCFAVTSGEQPGDSDDEFAEDLRPLVEETAVNQDVTLQEVEPSSSEPPTPEPPLQVKFLEKVIASAVSQGLSSLIDVSQNQNDDDSVQAGKKILFTYFNLSNNLGPLGFISEL